MDRERIGRLVDLNSDDHDAKNALGKLDARGGGTEPKFKVRDLVRITRTPQNQIYIDLKDHVGFITDDQGEYDKYGRMYYFQELNPKHGIGSGAGSVPEDCLEHFSPDWLRNLKRNMMIA